MQIHQSHRNFIVVAPRHRHTLARATEVSITAQATAETPAVLNARILRCVSNEHEPRLSHIVLGQCAGRLLGKWGQAHSVDDDDGDDNGEHLCLRGLVDVYLAQVVKVIPAGVCRQLRIDLSGTMFAPCHDIPTAEHSFR